MKFDLQPHLQGSELILRPLTPDDFESAFQSAADPLIWELHPQSDRYKKEVFTKFFKGAIESGGAFAILDKAHQEIIGSSRYYDYQPEKKQISIGYTFLSRKYWGGKTNQELKSLMLQHAFKFVDHVLFEIGENNFRSRRAIEKIGATLCGETALDGKKHVVYKIDRPGLS